MASPSLESMVKQFAKFRKLYAKACAPYMKEENISPSELDVLLFLTNNPSMNTAKQLTFYLEVSKGLIARSVDTLVKRNLVSIEEDTYDKRILHLSLTENSKPLIAMLQNKREEMDAKILKHISIEERKEVRRILEKINHRVEEIMEGIEHDEKG